MTERTAALELLADAARDFLAATMQAGTTYTGDELDALERMTDAIRVIRPPVGDA